MGLGLSLDSLNIADVTPTPPLRGSIEPAPVPVPVLAPVSKPASVSASEDGPVPSPLNIVLSGVSWLFKGNRPGPGTQDPDNTVKSEPEQAQAPLEPSAKEE